MGEGGEGGGEPIWNRNELALGNWLGVGPMVLGRAVGEGGVVMGR